MHLTFDDGPDPEYTPRVLEVLTRYGATATFFMIGDCAERHPNVVHAVLAQGSTVGNHTMTHTIDPRCVGADAAYLEEVAAATSLLKGITGRQPTAFRPPWGLFQWAPGSTAEAMEVEVNRMGMRQWLWDAHGADWENPQAPAATIVARIQERLAANAPNCGAEAPVILLHDGVPRHEPPRSHAEVIPAVDLLLKTYTEKGHSFEPLPGS